MGRHVALLYHIVILHDSIGSTIWEKANCKTFYVWKRTWLLGSKTLGLNVLELQFVMLANHDQNVLVFVLDLLKVCLYVKLESSVLQDLLCKSTWLN